MSDNIKLIIEIPKETYEYWKNHRDEYVLAEAIKNGIPLDEVKANIEKQIERDFEYAETETLKVPCHYGIANGLQNAIRFLDNIGKAESEEE